MKLRLAEAAARRLAERRSDQTGPLATAQKALWHSLLAGDIQEALKQADVVEAICGPKPPSALALKLIDRFNRMAADNARFKALEQQATQNLEPPGGDMKRGSFLRDRAMEKMLDGGPE